MKAIPLAHRTAYDDYATLLCACGTSIHDYPGSARRHESKWHTQENPARYERHEVGTH